MPGKLEQDVDSLIDSLKEMNQEAEATGSAPIHDEEYEALKAELMVKLVRTK